MPFGLICFGLVTVWYALHGHAPDDVATHRARARWYTTKTEPSYDDMAIKLRRVIIAARFRHPCPEQATRKKPKPSSQPGPQPGHDQPKLRNTRDDSRGRQLKKMIDFVNEAGIGAIGTVNDARAQVQRLWDQSGGFGCMLLLGHEWANPSATKRSWELIAQHVMPHFQGGEISHAQQTLDRAQYAGSKREDYAAQQMQAIATMTERYQQELAAKDSS